MCFKNIYPLSTYRELEPLCRRGNVVLVQNQQDGQLYVKKRVQSHAPALYQRLREEPVAGTPVLYGIYEDDQTPAQAQGAVPLILIEEYLPGHTLAERLEDGALFSEHECIQIGIQICHILTELHGRKPAIIHRDIKPSNVMLLPDGSVKLIDFSAAKHSTGKETQDTVLIGTAGFAAPEQYGFSASTPQTDLYALGVLLNTMRTGSLSREQQSDTQLGHVITRCLKMEPSHRYSTARELATALKLARHRWLLWLPPGFRSLCWYKMLPAILWYLFVFMFVFRVDFQDTTEPAVRACTRTILLSAGLLPVFLYANYLNMQRLFPFMRSSNRFLRLLGFALSPLFLCLLIFLLSVIVTALFV